MAVPPHDAVNLIGIVLFALNVRSGVSKLPPVASAPSSGSRNPVKLNAPRVTLKVQLDWFPLASRAVQVTGVVPTRNPEPEGGEHVTVGALSHASTVGVAKNTGTTKS